MTRRRHNLHSRSAFTLVEVLATLVLMGIVLPVAMRGLSLTLNTASSARHRAEAAALAETRLQEIVILEEWTSTGMSGDFGQDWPEYRWSCETAGRDFELTEIMVTVTWDERGQERSVSVSTLASSSNTTTGGTTQ